MRVYRLCPTTGEKQEPIRNTDGYSILGSPRRGAEKHHKKNEVLTKSEDEMIDLIREGYSVRVKTSSAPALVRRNLYIDGEPMR